MFKEGILINRNVYDQSRVQAAIMTSEGLDSPLKPLIFCPTFLVTRQVFRTLNEPTLNSMIYGGYGIGKTIGIIMFCEIVKFKSKFIMEANTDITKKR
jgi:hypothetical protein